VFSAFVSNDVLFRVSARTEIVTIDTKSRPALGFTFSRAKLLDSDNFLLSECELAVKPVDGSIIEFRRSGDGALFLTPDISQQPKTPALSCADGTVIDVARVDVIEAAPPPGARQAILANGVMTLGDLPREGASLFQGVISGDVSLSASALAPGPAEFVDQMKLLPGDKLILRAASGAPVAGYSTIIFDQGPGLQIVHQAVARDAELVRFGAKGPEASLIAPTFFDRLQTNFFWALLPLVLGLMSNSVALAFARRP
jgi:hypothetical protein